MNVKQKNLEIYLDVCLWMNVLKHERLKNNM